MAKHSSTQKGYVAVAGTIGAGKTSLVQWMQKRYGHTPFYEPNDENPYLADFYADMPRWAFQSQAYFLAHKFEMHQQIDQAAGQVVVDRTIYEDAEIFARNLMLQGHMSERDWRTYERLYAGIKRSLRPPTLLVAVTCSLPATKRRIKKRGRDMETTIPHEYLKRLHGLYEDWFASYDLSPVLRIDTTKLDYAQDVVDLIELQQTLDSALLR